LSSKHIVERDQDGNEKNDGDKGKRRRMGPHFGQWGIGLDLKARNKALSMVL
jgi:hypothetical protein